MTKIRPIANPGFVPEPFQLALGDIAINTYEGVAYLKKFDGVTETIIPIGQGTTTPGGPVNAVQVHGSEGGFEGSANFTWDTARLYVNGGIFASGAITGSALRVFTGETDQSTLAKQVASVTGGTTTVVAAVSTAELDGIVFHYVVKQASTDFRAGTIVAATDGTNVVFTEMTTTDIGNTSDFRLSMDVSGSDIRLIGDVLAGTWTIKSFYTTL